MRSRLFAVLLSFVTLTAFAQVSFTELPRPLQLYPRDAEDSAVVPIRGSVSILGYDSIGVEVYRNQKLRNTISLPATYNGGVAELAFAPKIRAELAEYSFRVYGKVDTITETFARRDSIVCGDVYLIAGQSNAVLSRGDVTWKHEYCRTLGIYNSQLAADTNWALSAADTNFKNPAVGVWALNLQKKIAETYNLPNCIINGAIGGKAIESMLRNDADPTKLTTIYGMMLNRARKAGVAEHAKAMFWYQGESNAGQNYLTSFISLYTDWQEDYPNLEKVYVFQIRPGCNITREHAQLREVQRTLTRYCASVRTISTMGIPFHDGCHFSTQGYEILADRVFAKLSSDFYGSADTISLNGPNIYRAYYTGPERTEIALVFSPLGSILSVTPDIVNDTVHASLKEYFYFDQAGEVIAVTPKNDTIFLTLSTPSQAREITYLPDKYYNQSSTIFYEGPWILNDRGVGAFSFWKFPIESPIAGIEKVKHSEQHFAVYPNPVIGNGSFHVTLEDPDAILIELYDLLGRKVKTVVDGVVGAGSYKIPFDVEPAYDRVLVARLRSSRGIESLQVIVGR